MPKTILVADDEPNIARLTKVNLERRGYNVVIAADGREALKQVEAARPDLILLDVMMPHLDGFEVLRHLKENPDTRSIPVVMLTVQAQDSDEFEAKNRGAALYLNKPVNPSELVAHVDRLLEGEDAD